MKHLALASALLLLACSTTPPGPSGFPAGSSRDTVVQGMGPPTGEHALPDGGKRLEYSGGTYGRQTMMFDFDASGRLVRSENVRDEAHFNAIAAGMDAGEVLSRIGSPSNTQHVAQQHALWSYRYTAPACQWFRVGVSQDNKVVDTSYAPDPMCADESFFGKNRMQ